MSLKIETNAIFVADAHYNEKNLEFLFFLKQVENKKIITKQIFLMGDMFDFLSYETKYFIKINKHVIELLNKLSKKIEIIYLEGNHDFNLKKLFPSIFVIRRQKQPLNLKLNNQTISISHGDKFENFIYNIFCMIIRNNIFLNILEILDVNNIISKKISYNLMNKHICVKMSNFDEFAKKRTLNYSSDIIVEGHFHQGKIYKTKNKLYVNVPSLSCDKKYFVLHNNEFKEKVL